MIIINIEKLRKRFIPMSETMLYILLSLKTERHGYGIMLYVKELTGGRIVLGAGTIYQSLRKLEDDGLITPVKEESRKKIYIISGTGERILYEEAGRIKEMYENINTILF